MKLREFTKELEETATIYNGIIRTSETYDEVHSIINDINGWNVQEDIIIKKLPIYPSFSEALRIAMDDLGFSERKLAEATTLNLSTIRRYLNDEVKDYKRENILTIGLAMGLGCKYMNVLFRAAHKVSYTSDDIILHSNEDLLYCYFMHNDRLRKNMDFINSIIYCFNLTESGKVDPVPYLPNNKTYLNHIKKELAKLDENGDNPLQTLLKQHLEDRKEIRKNIINQVIKEDK